MRSAGTEIRTGPGRPLVAVATARSISGLALGSVLQLRRPLHDRLEGADHVELLERLAPLHVAADLADDGDHGRGIGPGGVEADGQVGRLPVLGVPMQTAGRPVSWATASAMNAADPS